jgi:hypothetical protein
MHQQVRVKPAVSPPNLERLLQFLADEPLIGDEILDPDNPVGVNIVAAGGSRVELGGRFAFVPDHRHMDACRRALGRGGYGGDTVKWLTIEDNPDQLKMQELEDRPGSLLEFVAAVRAENGDTMRIKDILVGTERPDGRVPVQIFSVPVSGGDDEDDDENGEED